MSAVLRKLKSVKPLISFAMLAVLLGLAFSYAMFQGGFVSWFLFFSFLPFALYCILLFFYPMNFQAERIISPKIYNAGDQIEVTLILARKIPFPLLFLFIEDRITGSLQEVETKRVFFPGFKRKLKMAYTIRNAPRGEHLFKYIRLKTGDPLGLLEKEKLILCEQTLLVYPQFEDMMHQPFRKVFEQGVISGFNLQNDTSLLAGIREYNPGDRFSWIDWKASARTNEMMTKEFEARQSGDSMILLDLEPSKDFELLVKFAASLARAVIRSGGQIGLFFAGHERLLIPSRNGMKQENIIFYHLAKVKPDATRPLEKHFGDQALAGQSAVCIAVTSRLTKQFMDGAGKLTRQQQMVIICLIRGKEATITPEEMALAASASGKGMIVHIIDAQRFHTAFAGVKQA